MTIITIAEFMRIWSAAMIGLLILSIAGLFYETAKKALKEGNWLIIPLQIFFVIWGIAVAIGIVVLT